MRLDPELDAYRLGTLPDPAPLAGAYVPMQEKAEPRYGADRALARGTLFPGLDLPFMGLVSPDMEITPRTELMAICFVVDELALYLDTHAEDREAFELYQTMLAMAKEAKARYVRSCGPIRQSDQLGMTRYAWLDGPWPWELSRREEG
ncbi:MAG: spore coat protein CotJB [Oscillospiraceae bacterium]|nr:spore coat protein CotJB [Oscillospiraceae bacterium]